MAENLRTSSYANGDPISNVTDASQWADLNTGAWAHYDNDNQYENLYGKLYNWYAATDSRNVCPNGWHVPTNEDWIELTDYLGGQSVAGGKMKTTGTDLWNAPNQDATNESGFSGLPGGERSPNGNFEVISFIGSFWSTTNNWSNNAFIRYLDYEFGFVANVSRELNFGLSIRCIKD